MAALLCASLLAASWPAEAAGFRANPGRLPARVVPFALSQPLVGGELKIRVAGLKSFAGEPMALRLLIAQAAALPEDPSTAASAEAAKLLITLLSSPGMIAANRPELASALGEDGVALLESSALGLTAPARRALEHALAGLSLDALYDGAPEGSPRAQVLALYGVHLETPRTAHPVVEETARRLENGPIAGWEFGSEAGFVMSFSKKARAAFGPGRPLEAETRLLEGLRDWHVRRGMRLKERHFQKSMAILCEDFYQIAVTAGSTAGPEERLALAGLRAHYGALEVERLKTFPLPDKPPVLADAPPQGLGFARLLAGGLKAAFRDAVALVSPRDLFLPAFPSVLARWALSPERRAMLTAFHDGLAFSSPGPGSVWACALEATGGDAALAAELLGVIVGQAKAPLRYVEQHVLPLHPEAAGAREAFAAAAKDYYLIGRIDEMSRRRTGRSALYAPGVRARSPKFWHFYAAAALALRLAAHPARPARWAGFLLAAGYETKTFFRYLRSMPEGERFRHAGILLKDALRDVATQVRGHRFGRPLALGAPPELVPLMKAGRLRTAWRRARAYAQGLVWQFWWSVGPPTRLVWRGYRDRLASDSAVRDPRSFFVRLRLLGLTGRIASSDGWATADAVVLREARALFARHVAADAEARAAFERFLDRAVRYNPGKRRTKLRATLAYHLREGSVLPPRRLAAYYDGLLRDETALAEALGRKDAVLAAFQETTDRLILDANRDAAPGRRVLAVLVFGSFASGAPRPGSDIDLQLVTEDGAAPPETGLPEALRREWARRSDIKLDILSFTYVPPDPVLLGRLHPEPILILSPYPEATALLGRAGGAPRSPAPRVTLAGRLVRGLFGAWLRVLLSTTDRYDARARKK